MKPSVYQNEIQRARKLIESNDPQNALIALRKALGLSHKLTLAFYYIGKCFELLNDNQEALKNYREGLKHNPENYKCSIGEFEALEKLDRKTEAYEVLTKILLKYPLSSQRLGDIFKLAIFTEHFDHVNQYYDIFLKIDRRSEELKNIVTAGLYACGQHSCTLNNFDEAVDFFKKCCATSVRNSDYIKKSVDILIQYNRAELATEFLSMFSSDAKNSDEWKSLDFQISSLNEHPEKSIQKGCKLIADGIKELSVFIKTAKLLIQQNKKTHAENIIYTGVNRCPHAREELLKILN
jgi:tetratricopeptide (TPR) repeat protein